MTPQPDSPASAIDIVLVGTQHPGNLGAAARAIKTMGLRQLVLVAPEHPADHPDAIAMAVLGRVSLAGCRGSIIGPVLVAALFSVIISGFTSIRLDAYYQEMVKGAIIVGAVVLDQWRQRQRTRG